MLFCGKGLPGGSSFIRGKRGVRPPVHYIPARGRGQTALLRLSWPGLHARSEDHMTELIKTDLCVIGAGSAGLTAAAGAVQMGARVVLIEHNRMGGDCLNVGCVPSKSLLAAARLAQSRRSGDAMGITPSEPEVDFTGVMAHVRNVIRAIEPHDSEERFTGLGVRVLRETARFLDRHTVQAGETRVRARRFLLATGSRPLVPPIKGLSGVPYLTNESLFDLDERPKHLVVVGGGPIGMEMAQAFRRLGSKVTVLEMARCLPADDRALAEIVIRQLESEGVTLLENTRAVGVSGSRGDITVTVEQNGTKRQVNGSHLLIAVGREPAVDSLDLDAAGVKTDRRGVKVDAGLRTSNPRILAAGDVTGRAQFTHLASYQAGIALRRALLRLPAKADYRSLPWCTYTEPELAQTGLTDKAALDQGLDVRVTEADVGENDRARAEGIESGRIRIVVDKRGRILGAGICAPHAGELIVPWVMAVQKKMKLKDVAGLIMPYPTLSESGKRAAGEFYTPVIYGKWMRRAVRFMQHLPG